MATNSAADSSRVVTSGTTNVVMYQQNQFGGTSSSNVVNKCVQNASPVTSPSSTIDNAVPISPKKVESFKEVLNDLLKSVDDPDLDKIVAKIPDVIAKNWFPLAKSKRNYAFVLVLQ